MRPAMVSCRGTGRGGESGFRPRFPCPAPVVLGMEAVTSISTLQLYERDEIEASLKTTGFEVDEALDVPDRPGLERVFVARRALTRS